MNGAIEADLEALAGRLRAVTVAVRVGRGGAGSGVVVSGDGAIVTNAHVANAPFVEVVLADGRSFPARLERRDARRDLALLRIPARGLAAAEFRDAADLRPGEILVALGHPLGVPNAMALGIVRCAPGRSRFVEADLRLEPGNSGGPLADVNGRVLGINSMVVAGGTAVAIAAREVLRFAAGVPQERGRAA